MFIVESLKPGLRAFPGTEVGRLFHPCRCSGSIKYIHQHCLARWLVLKKAESCELCGTPFVRTPLELVACVREPYKLFFFHT